MSISCRFWDIQCRKISWLWNLGQRSLTVIETDTYRSATYDFLFHSKHGPIWHRFRDRQRFQSKIAKNFPPPCILRPSRRGCPWNWVSARGSKN